MKIFLHNSRRYTRIFPSPKMYNSQMVRAVTNRGAIFAMDVDTGEYTVLPGTLKLQSIEMGLRKIPQKKKTVSKQLLLTGI